MSAGGTWERLVQEVSPQPAVKVPGQAAAVRGGEAWLSTVHRGVPGAAVFSLAELPLKPFQCTWLHDGRTQVRGLEKHCPEVVRVPV